VVLQAEHAKTAEYGASDQKEVADEVKWQRAIYQVQVLFEHQQPQKTEDAEEGNVGERRGDLSAAGTFGKVVADEERGNGVGRKGE
jgi:hypothetical protein